jgi:hypothetical protein
VRLLVTAKVIEKSRGGLTARQERVAGLKDYFYVIDVKMLEALSRSKDGR